jgi:hypothetical protein
MSEQKRYLLAGFQKGKDVFFEGVANAPEVYRR